MCSTINMDGLEPTIPRLRGGDLDHYVNTPLFYLEYHSLLNFHLAM
jgi:hypothetical protein